MGTTLTGTTPQDTYDSLIKVTDNGPLSGSLKVLTDGLGNNSTLSLSTTAASIAGTLAVTGNATFDTTTLFVDAANDRVGVGTITPSEKLQIQGNVVVNKDSTSANFVSKTFTTGHAVANRGGSVLFGMDDSTATGMKITTSAATNPSFNKQEIEFITHEGGGSVGTRLFINSTGNVGIGTSSPAVPLDVVGNIRSSTGILFGSDTAAANLLDDYEEGTFTPTASSGITINTINNATYTKIGNTVTFEIWLKVDIGSADFVVAGLPFTGSGRATGSMSNTSQKETIANLLINNDIYGYAATTVLDDDLLIGGVYRVA